MSSPFVTPKYLGDAGKSNPFFNHSSLGFPLRSPFQGLLSNKEVDSLAHSCDFHCELLDLCVQEQLTRYAEIMDRIVNHIWMRFGPYTPPVYDPESNTCKVVVQWVEVKAELTPALRKQQQELNHAGR